MSSVDLPLASFQLRPDPATKKQQLRLDPATKKQQRQLAQAQQPDNAQAQPSAQRGRGRSPRTRHRRARAREGDGDGDGGGGSDPDDDGGFVTGPQLCRRYKVSEQTIWRWRADPALGFPKCMVINRRNYWRLADLVKWERRRARRDAA